MTDESTLSLHELCNIYTDLVAEDVHFLQDLAEKLSCVSELTGTDIFIDALTTNRKDAIVLAWACPPGRRSLYSRSVVGEIAYATREPAVYQSFSSGKTMRLRGVSQEGIPIAQTVVPLMNSAGRIIGVLIMERDISSEIRQEEQVEFLSEAAEGLSSTLMSLTMTGFPWEEWLGNGIFVLGVNGKITYANKNAAWLYRQNVGNEPISNDLLSTLRYESLRDLLAGLKEPVEYDFGDTSYLFQAHPLVAYGDVSGCVVSFQDVTELRRKERQLNAQSAMIREIHHRVKNNLQNVVSLLRLQMHRSESDLVRSEFEACINRILSIARVYDVFAFQSSEPIDLLELAGYILEKLVDNFAMPDQEIKTTVQGKPVKIAAGQAVPMALVINELVTNSLKHGVKSAPTGEISIFVEETDGTVNMLVADSGSEYVDSPSNNPEGKLGLYIVNILICEQLSGEFNLERCGGSTVAKVSFLINDEEL